MLHQTLDTTALGRRVNHVGQAARQLCLESRTEQRAVEELHGLGSIERHSRRRVAGHDEPRQRRHKPRVATALHGHDGEALQEFVVVVRSRLDGIDPGLAAATAQALEGFESD